MQDGGTAISGASVRLAYLCNVYPAVSHSFIRREIEAVEAAGHEVHRFSLRLASGDLRDDADRREAAITMAALGGGVLPLLAVALGLLFSRPAATMQALAAALRLSGPGLKRKTRHLAYWFEAGWLVRRMEQLRIQHLHAHFGTNPAAVAAIARAWGGPPFSFTVHGPDEFDAPLELGLPLKIEAAAFVVAISSYCRSQLMRWSQPAHWNKIQIIHCGVDASFLDAAARPVAPESRELVCVARWSAQEGLPLLVRAARLLRTGGQRFHLTIIGDGELRSQLGAEIRSQKLSDLITLTGIRSSAEIREHLQAARAFVLPSFAEGLPVVLMEALALSRPVIATAIAGIPELVDEQCGWLIPAGSEEALAGAMISALELSPKDLTAKGRTGRERVQRLHDATKNAERLLEIMGRSEGAQ